MTKYDHAMRAVIQRVERAWVDVGVPGEASGRRAGEIGRGLLVLVGVAVGDGERDAQWLATKVAGSRIFEDSEGRMNLPVAAVGGSLLLVPNFTVAGDAQRGQRPSFDGAMRAPESRSLFDRVVTLVRESAARAGDGGLGVRVETGVFGATMRVGLVNDGPVTLVVDSRASPGGTAL